MKIVFPEQIDGIEELIADSIFNAFLSDSFDDWKFLNQIAESPTEIVNKFQSLSYDKGAAIIRMFMEGIGRDTWNKGVRKYLKAHQFSSADTNDLHAALQEAIDEDLPDSSVDIAQLMSTWEDDPGFPIITVNRTGDKIILTQKVGSMHKFDELKLYAIPVNYVTSSDPNFNLKTTKLWFTTRSAEIDNFHDDWMILNIQQSGFYHVNYDDNLTDAIIEQLITNHTIIHEKNRVSFLVNLKKLIDEEEISGHQILRLLSYLKYEKNPQILRHLNFIIFALTSHLQHESENFINLKIYLKETLTNIYADEKLKEGMHEMVLTDFEIDEWKNLKIQEIIAMMNATNVTDSFNYCNGIFFGNETIFKHFHDLLVRMPENEIKYELISGLACTRDENSFLKLLNTLLSCAWSEILQQQYISIILSQLDSSIKIQAFFKFLELNFDKIVEK